MSSDEFVKLFDESWDYLVSNGVIVPTDQPDEWRLSASALIQLSSETESRQTDKE